MAATIFFRGLYVSATALVEDEIRNDLNEQTSIASSVTISIPQMANAAYTIPRRTNAQETAKRPWLESYKKKYHWPLSGLTR